MARSSSTLNSMSVRRSGAVLAVFIAAACMFLCFLNWTLLSGLEYGYFYGVFRDPPTSGLVAHGPNYYQSMNVWYLVITLSFLVYVAARFRQTLYGFVMRVAALCVAIYPFFNMLYYKYDVMVISQKRDVSRLQNSIYVDVFCLVSIVVLVGFEIMQLGKTTEKTGIGQHPLKIGH